MQIKFNSTIIELYSFDKLSLEKEQIMKLSDQIIAEISRLLQVAIITGTDVVDNLRLIEVESQDDLLVLTSDYVKRSERNIETLIAQAAELEQKNG